MEDAAASQLGELEAKLDLQAEAISKLVEVVSAIEGVDAASLSPYAVRIRRPRSVPVNSPAAAVETVEVPAAESEPSPPAAPQSAIGPAGDQPHGE